MTGKQREPKELELRNRLEFYVGWQGCVEVHSNDEESGHPLGGYNDVLRIIDPDEIDSVIEWLQAAKAYAESRRKT